MEVEETPHGSGGDTEWKWRRHPMEVEETPHGSGGDTPWKWRRHPMEVEETPNGSGGDTEWKWRRHPMEGEETPHGSGGDTQWKTSRCWLPTTKKKGRRHGMEVEETPNETGGDTPWKWRRHGMEVEETPHGSGGDTPWKWRRHGMEVEETPHGSGGDTPWKWRRHPMEVEETPNGSGGDTEWKWRRHPMEVEETPHGSGGDTQWKWRRHPMEVEETPHGSGGDTQWKWRRHGMEVEETPNGSGGDTPWKWRRHPMEVEETPHGSGGDTPWKWRRHPMEVEETPNGSGGDTEWKWRRHPMEVEETPHGSGGDTPWKWRRHPMEVEETPMEGEETPHGSGGDTPWKISRCWLPTTKKKGRRHGMEVEETPNGSRGDTPWKWRRHGMEVEETPHGSGGDTPWKWRRHPMEGEETPHGSGGDTEWKWRRHPMEVEETPNGSGGDTEWKWRRHPMEVEETPHGSGGDTQWKWRRHPMEVEETPNGSGGDTPWKWRRHPMEGEETPHGSGGDTEWKWRRHPMEVEETPNGSGGDTPWKWRRHPMEVEETPHGSGGDTQWKWRRHPMEVEETPNGRGGDTQWKGRRHPMEVEETRNGSGGDTPWKWRRHPMEVEETPHGSGGDTPWKWRRHPMEVEETPHGKVQRLQALRAEEVREQLSRQFFALKVRKPASCGKVTTQCPDTTRRSTHRERHHGCSTVSSLHSVRTPHEGPRTANDTMDVPLSVLYTVSGHHTKVHAPRTTPWMFHCQFFTQCPDTTRRSTHRERHHGCSTVSSLHSVRTPHEGPRTANDTMDVPLSVLYTVSGHHTKVHAPRTTPWMFHCQFFTQCPDTTRRSTHRERHHGCSTVSSLHSVRTPHEGPRTANDTMDVPLSVLYTVSGHHTKVHAPRTTPWMFHCQFFTQCPDTTRRSTHRERHHGCSTVSSLHSVRTPHEGPRTANDTMDVPLSVLYTVSGHHTKVHAPRTTPWMFHCQFFTQCPDTTRRSTHRERHHGCSTVSSLHSVRTPHEGPRTANDTMDVPLSVLYTVSGHHTKVHAPRTTPWMFHCQFFTQCPDTTRRSTHRERHHGCSTVSSLHSVRTPHEGPRTANDTMDVPLSVLYTVSGHHTKVHAPRTTPWMFHCQFFTQCPDTTRRSTHRERHHGCSTVSSLHSVRTPHEGPRTANNTMDVPLSVLYTVSGHHTKVHAPRTTPWMFHCQFFTQCPDTTRRSTHRERHHGCSTVSSLHSVRTPHEGPRTANDTMDVPLSVLYTVSGHHTKVHAPRTTPWMFHCQFFTQCPDTTRRSTHRERHHGCSTVSSLHSVRTPHEGPRTANDTMDVPLSVLYTVSGHHTKVHAPRTTPWMFHCQFFTQCPDTTRRSTHRERHHGCSTVSSLHSVRTPHEGPRTANDTMDVPLSVLYTVSGHHTKVHAPRTTPWMFHCQFFTQCPDTTRRSTHRERHHGCSTVSSLHSVRTPHEGPRTANDTMDVPLSVLYTVSGHHTKVHAPRTTPWMFHCQFFTQCPDTTRRSTHRERHHGCSTVSSLHSVRTPHEGPRTANDTMDVPLSVLYTVSGHHTKVHAPRTTPWMFHCQFFTQCPDTTRRSTHRERHHGCSTVSSLHSVRTPHEGPRTANDTMDVPLSVLYTVSGHHTKVHAPRTTPWMFHCQFFTQCPDTTRRSTHRERHHGCSTVSSLYSVRTPHEGPRTANDTMDVPLSVLYTVSGHHTKVHAPRTTPWMFHCQFFTQCPDTTRRSTHRERHHGCSTVSSLHSVRTPHEGPRTANDTMDVPLSVLYTVSGHHTKVHAPRTTPWMFHCQFFTQCPDTTRRSTHRERHHGCSTVSSLHSVRTPHEGPRTANDTMDVPLSVLYTVSGHHTKVHAPRTTPWMFHCQFFTQCPDTTRRSTHRERHHGCSTVSSLHSVRTPHEGPRTANDTMDVPLSVLYTVSGHHTKVHAPRTTPWMFHCQFFTQCPDTTRRSTHRERHHGCSTVSSLHSVRTPHEGPRTANDTMDVPLSVLYTVSGHHTKVHAPRTTPWMFHCQFFTQCPDTTRRSTHRERHHGCSTVSSLHSVRTPHEGPRTANDTMDVPLSVLYTVSGHHTKVHAPRTTPWMFHCQFFTQCPDTTRRSTHRERHHGCSTVSSLHSVRTPHEGPRTANDTMDVPLSVLYTVSGHHTKVHAPRTTPWMFHCQFFTQCPDTTRRSTHRERHHGCSTVSSLHSVRTPHEGPRTANDTMDVPLSVLYTVSGHHTKVHAPRTTPWMFHCQFFTQCPDTTRRSTHRERHHGCSTVSSLHSVRTPHEGPRTANDTMDVPLSVLYTVSGHHTKVHAPRTTPWMFHCQFFTQCPDTTRRSTHRERHHGCSTVSSLHSVRTPHEGPRTANDTMDVPLSVLYTVSGHHTKVHAPRTTPWMFHCQFFTQCPDTTRRSTHRERHHGCSTVSSLHSVRTPHEGPRTANDTMDVPLSVLYTVSGHHTKVHAPRTTPWMFHCQFFTQCPDTTRRSTHRERHHGCSTVSSLHSVRTPHEGPRTANDTMDVPLSVLYTVSGHHTKVHAPRTTPWMFHCQFFTQCPDTTRRSTHRERHHGCSTRSIPLTVVTRSIPLTVVTRSIPLTVVTRSIPLTVVTRSIPLTVVTRSIPLTVVTRSIPLTVVTRSIPLTVVTRFIPTHQQTGVGVSSS
ncbi:hypothetical protein ACOMHN_060602 [Nucella lapillus]